MMEFQDFPKMARLTREVIVTEKIEGVVVFHAAGNGGFKKTVDKDDIPKALRK